MAGDTTSYIVYRKDERGVILDSAVVVGDDEVPEGFETSAEYESLEFTTKEAPPVEESKLTVSEDQVDLRQTIDVIKGDTQEGPSDPGGLGDEDYDIVAVAEDGLQPGDEVTAGDGSEGVVVGGTIDEVKDESDTQEGPSDPGGEQTDDDGPPPQGGAGSGRDAWAQYAAARNVEVSETDSRDDIVAAVKKAGYPV